MSLASWSLSSHPTLHAVAYFYVTAGEEVRYRGFALPQRMNYELAPIAAGRPIPFELTFEYQADPNPLSSLWLSFNEADQAAILHLNLFGTTQQLAEVEESLNSSICRRCSAMLARHARMARVPRSALEAYAEDRIGFPSRAIVLELQAAWDRSDRPADREWVTDYRVYSLELWEAQVIQSPWLA